MSIKKEVVSRIKDKLIKEQNIIRSKLSYNAYKINQLSEENTLIKREIAKLGDLIKSLES